MLTRNIISHGASSLIGLLLLAATALGQTGTSSGNEPLKGPCAPASRGAKMEGKGPMGGLLDSLNLDSTQRTNIDTVIATIHQQNKDKMTRPSDEQRSQIKDLRQQMHAAREDQDKAKMQELHTQLDQITAPRREQHTQVQQQVHDAIKAQLRPDQVDAFEQKWTTFTDKTGKNGGGKAHGMHGRAGGQGPRKFHQAVMSLDSLSADQKSQLERIFQDFRSTMQSKSGGEAPDRKTAATDLRSKVESVLTDAQKTQLASRLKNGRHMQHRGRHGAPNGAEPQSTESGS